MNNQVSFNFQILPAEQTFLAAVSAAALYGRGVFTTLAIYDSKPFLWEKHWRRLLENAARIGIDLSDFDERKVKAALLRLLFQNNLQNGRARLTFFDERSSKIWNSGAAGKTSLLITTAEIRQTKDVFSLTVSPFPTNSKSPLAGVKSCNYLENTLVLEEARKRGFDEAIRLNERGEIVSASMANVFWIKDKRIFTPPLGTGCLAGTTRAFLMEHIALEESFSTVDELYRADEIFLTSSGIGIRGARFETVEKKTSPMLVKLNKLLDLERLRK
jgi:branched-chain amino acid aminotransferase